MYNEIEQEAYDLRFQKVNLEQELEEFADDPEFVEILQYNLKLIINRLEQIKAKYGIVY